MSHSNSASGVPLTVIIPTGSQVPYTSPSLPTLLSLVAFFVLLAIPTLLSSSFPVFGHQPSSPHDHEVGASSSTVESPIRSYTLDAAFTIILPLLLGALFGPSITSNSILSTSTQRTLIDIGYIGLLLLIFEAGVSLDAESLKLMWTNAPLSSIAALTGALVPIAISMGLGLGAYGYTSLQSFASGASLASTSLGTTLALLVPTPEQKSSSTGEQTPPSMGMDLRRTRVGCILVCAALLDDIFGLVIASIIPGLAQTDSEDNAGVKWQSIVRPILVSLAFGFGTPLAAMGMKRVVSRFLKNTPPCPQVLFVVIVMTFMAFVAGSVHAGTSELFGAYLAGSFVSYVFQVVPEENCTYAACTPQQSIGSSKTPIVAHERDVVPQGVNHESQNPAHDAFVAYIQPILTHLLAPLFFASIGAALPIKSMFTTHPHATQITLVVTTQTGSENTSISIDSGKASHQVIWRGLVYAFLMMLAKMVVGVWMLIWPDPNAKTNNDRVNTLSQESNSSTGDIESTQRSIQKIPEGSSSTPQPHTVTPTLLEQNKMAVRTTMTSNEPSRLRSALLLGLAMVARGEIALIIAQLARPLLIGPPGPSSASTTSSESGTSTMITRIPIPDEEPYAVVIWAILLSTVGGALGVGALIASWKKKN